MPKFEQIPVGHGGLEEGAPSRAPVKKSSDSLKLSRKRLGASQDMEIVDDGTTAQIEEILAQAAIPGASSLPATDVGQRMLNRYSLAQFAAPLRSLLALA